MSFGSRSLPPPTAEEWLRWQWIRDTGICAATNRRGHVEIHHLLSDGGLRLGHRYTVGLAPEVHAEVKARWFKETWPNQKLLDRQDELICWGPRATIPARPERVKHPPRRRKGSKRGTHCTRPDKIIPRTRFV